MDKEFQTSFVPKKTAAQKAPDQKRHSGPSGLINLVAFVVFIASLVSAGGAYFFRSSLVDRVETFKVSLARAKSAFEPTLITELQILDKRMEAATDILNNHVVVSPIFKLLEEVTLPSVRYSDFTYEINPDNPRLVNVILTGEARGYNHIALQADLYSKNAFIKNPIFSDFSLDQNSNVDFNVIFSVDRNLVSYESFLEREESLGNTFTPELDFGSFEDVGPVLPVFTDPTGFDVNNPFGSPNN